MDDMSYHGSDNAFVGNSNFELHSLKLKTRTMSTHIVENESTSQL
jgi:hypothetical protein